MEKEKKMLDIIEKLKQELENDKKKLEEEKRIFEEEKKKQKQIENEKIKQEEINKEKYKVEEEKRKLEEDKRKFEEDKRIKEEMEKEKKIKEENEKEKERLKKEKEDLEEEKRKIKKEREELEEEKRKIKGEKEKQDEEKNKIKEEQDKQEEEKKKIKEEKDKIEEDKKRLQIIENENKKKEEDKIKIRKLNINKKIESFTYFGKNNSNLQSERMSNNGINLYNIRDSENSNQLKKNTLRDSDLLEQEVIEVHESKNNEIINIDNENKNNNYIKETINEDNINDYQRINDKEISNKIKYELKKDLLNKQKKSYNMMILTELRNKPDFGKKMISNKSTNNLIDTKSDRNRTKLTLLDLENKKDKNIKEIEKLLKGGVDENKLTKLENTYKNNKEIMNIINSYKNKKVNLDKNNLIEEESSSNSINIININRVKSKKNIKDDININMKYKENKFRPKMGKGLLHNTSSSVGNQNNYYHNQSISSIQDYYDLTPFYYISNGNKISKNMWGFNEKNYNRNEYSTINNNNMTQEQIIQNKLKIYKDKIYKPFLDKVEKEKHNEYKRIQILRSINDPNIKNNLETKFGIDRGKIDLELAKEKERINKAIKNYENQLILNESENKKFLEQNNIFFD